MNFHRQQKELNLGISWNDIMSARALSMSEIISTRAPSIQAIEFKYIAKTEH